MINAKYIVSRGQKMNSIQKKFRCFIFLIIICLIICSCSHLKSQDQMINVSISKAFPERLDPGKLSEQSSMDLANALYEGLVRLKPDGTYEKAMAVNWDIEDNGLKYIFHLREAKWANGEKLTAQDFEFAWKRVLDPNNSSPYAYMLYDIVSAEGYHRFNDSQYFGKKAQQDEVKINALDECTLVVELEKPNPAFIKKLSHPVFFPLPQKQVEESDNYFLLSKVYGNGPFTLKSIQKNKYQLVKNKFYWDQENVNLASMNWYVNEEEESWKMWQKGKVDVIFNIPFKEISPGLKNNTIKTSPVGAVYFYQFNVTKKPFNDLRVRKAFAYSIDRNHLVQELLKGGQTPALGLIPGGIFDAEINSDFRQIGGNLITGSLKEAKELLAEAGYPNGQEFPKLEILINNEESHYYLANLLREDWQKNLGIECTITVLDWEELVRQNSSREFEISLMGWQADYADPMTFLNSYTRGGNDTGWYNSDYANYLNISKASYDEIKRMEALHQAENLLISEMPVLPIYHYTRVFAVKDKVSGLFLPPTGPSAEWKWTKVNKQPE